MKAILMLEDGRSFWGESVNQAKGERIAGVILNTAVVGYQEMMTDPANHGKILVLTYPLIGNYGVAPKFNESKKVWLSGLAIKEKTNIYSNWQAKSSFEQFISENNLLTIHKIDTRTLTVHLRQKGEMPGIISTECFDLKELAAKIQSFRKAKAESVLPEVSSGKITVLNKAKPKAKKIAVLDIGASNSLIRQLQTMGVGLTLLPYNTTAEEILRLKFQGLIISNGPEQDPGLAGVAENVRKIVGKIPVLGISCGHQVLAQSIGAKITKMKLGHRGVNYPINKPASYKGEITSQNHSYTVDSESLAKIKNVKVTEYNLNDRTVEEIESKKMMFIGAQYIPSSPGFDEVNPVFHRFVKMLERSK
jgi:carbamoyl-phosphate synthase small subunit